MQSIRVLPLPEKLTRIDAAEIVMGLHWAPASGSGRPRGEPANLDAVCLLTDSRYRPREVVRYCVATVQRSPHGWTMGRGGPRGVLLTELLSRPHGGFPV